MKRLRLRIFWFQIQGIKNWTHEEAVKVAGESPDSAKEDVYEAIARGEHPSWTMYVQVRLPFSMMKPTVFLMGIPS